MKLTLLTAIAISLTLGLLTGCHTLPGSDQSGYTMQFPSFRYVGPTPYYYNTDYNTPHYYYDKHNRPHYFINSNYLSPYYNSYYSAPYFNK